MAVLVAVVLVFLIMPLFAVVIDLGMARAVQERVHNAAESAAVAAALSMRHGEPGNVDAAVLAAKRYAARNLGIPEGSPEWSTCPDDQGGGTPVECIRVDTARKEVSVRVPPRTTPSVFSAVLGAGPAAVSASASAAWGTTDPNDCTLCVLGDYEGGNQRVLVYDGDVAVGGRLSASLVQPDLGAAGGELRADLGRHVFAGIPYTGSGVSPTPEPLSEGLQDPSASLPLPTPATVGASSTRSTSGSGVCAPGIYVDVTGCSSFTGGGVYILTGRPNDIVTTRLPADLLQATVYVTCSRFIGSEIHMKACAGTDLGVRFGGTTGGDRTLRAPGQGAYSGVAVLYDPVTPRSQRLASGGRLSIEGDVLGRGVRLREPDSSGGAASIRGRLLVGQVLLGISGTGRLAYEVTGRADGGTLRDSQIRLTG